MAIRLESGRSCLE